MAEKEAKKADAPAAAAAAPAKGDDKKGAAPAEGKAKGGGLLSKTPVMLGGVMILEALVLFAGFKFLMGSAPRAATADVITAEAPAGEGHGDGGKEGGEHGGAAGGESKPSNKKKQVEIPVVEFRAPNKQSGRTFIYDVAIFAMAKGEDEPKVKETIKSREALIKDRIRTIIAQSDPEKLEGGTEPNLDTLRRQVKVQLDDIIGEGIIEEVLVPRCIPFRTDY